MGFPAISSCGMLSPLHKQGISMPEASSQSLFISHTHTDQPIADAIRDAARSIFNNVVAVNYSTNKELDGGIRPGDDWFRWIGQQVRQSKVALILLTPASVQKPWVLWEAGAVAGAALASDGEGHRKLRPISYRLRGADIPTPFGRDQVTNGLDERDVERLFEDLIQQFASGLSPSALIKTGQQLGPACKTYLAQAIEACRTSPMLVTEAAVQEWLERISSLEAEGRSSETDELHDWLNVAFGRDGGENERPLDLRIHRKLGELYARAGMPERAAREFDLARQLAPRDVYVLRRLGKAYLDQGKGRWEDAGKVIGVIEELDKTAFVRNAENAALKARWFSDRGAQTEAAAVLKAAFVHNPRSYYLADLLGQAQLLTGLADDARQTYSQVLALIDSMRERNVWAVATGFTASLVTGDEHRQRAFLDELAALSTTSEEAETIQRGVRKVAEAAGIDPHGLAKLEEAVGVRRAGP
jgi:tetratricopeptide (TPR) repeat protein